MASPFANWDLRKKHFAAAFDADQVELTAMLNGKATFGVGLFDEKVSGAFHDMLAGESPEWKAKDVLLEGKAAAIAEEFERRAELLGDDYPFTVNEGHVTYQESGTFAYEYCLVCARHGDSDIGIQALAGWFEMLLTTLLASYLGEGARAVRTGWPPLDGVYHPVRPKKTYRALRLLAGEWMWGPKGGLPDDPDPQHVKELGVDVLAWKKFPDARCGKLWIAAQCACGKSDWTNKLSELNFDRLFGWFADCPPVWPTRCFAVPFHLPNTVEFQQICRQAGLVLDRSRVTALAEAMEGDFPADLRDQLHSIAYSGNFSLPKAAVAAAEA